MGRADSFEKTLMMGKIEGRRRGWQRMRWFMASLIQWAWVWVNSWSWWWTGRPSMLQCMGLQRVGRDWVTELNWTFVGKVMSLLFNMLSSWCRVIFKLWVKVKFLPSWGLLHVSLRFHPYFLVLLTFPTLLRQGKKGCGREAGVFLDSGFGCRFSWCLHWLSLGRLPFLGKLNIHFSD